MEGASKLAAENELVGRFEVSGLAALPSGIDVTFAVNASGIFEVHAGLFVLMWINVRLLCETLHHMQLLTNIMHTCLPTDIQLHVYLALTLLNGVLLDDCTASWHVPWRRAAMKAETRLLNLVR